MKKASSRGGLFQRRRRGRALLASVRIGRDFARFGQDEGLGGCSRDRGNLTPNPFPWGKGNNRVGWHRCGEPNPLTPFPVKEGGTEKVGTLDAETRNRYRLRCAAGVTPAPSGLISPPLSARNANWMRRRGTGTGFAGAKLSEILPRSERSLAMVRMTEGASVVRFGRDDGSSERGSHWSG